MLLSLVIFKCMNDAYLGRWQFSCIVTICLTNFKTIFLIFLKNLQEIVKKSDANAKVRIFYESVHYCSSNS